MTQIVRIGEDSARQIERTVTRIDRTPTNQVGGRRRNKHTFGAGGDSYKGFFIVTNGEDEDTVDISAGKVINGTTVTDVPAEEAVGTIGSLYIALEVWYDGSWQVGWYVEASYPTQAKTGAYFVWRVLIASRANTTSKWVRQVCGELHNPRAVPA